LSVKRKGWCFRVRLLEQQGGNVGTKVRGGFNPLGCSLRRVGTRGGSGKGEGQTQTTHYMAWPKQKKKAFFKILGKGGGEKKGLSC